jgi:hypothetical protein
MDKIFLKSRSTRIQMRNEGSFPRILDERGKQIKQREHANQCAGSGSIAESCCSHGRTSSLVKHGGQSIIFKSVFHHILFKGSPKCVTERKHNSTRVQLKYPTKIKVVVRCHKAVFLRVEYVRSCKS